MPVPDSRHKPLLAVAAYPDERKRGRYNSCVPPKRHSCFQKTVCGATSQYNSVLGRASRRQLAKKRRPRSHNLQKKHPPNVPRTAVARVLVGPASLPRRSLPNVEELESPQNARRSWDRLSLSRNRDTGTCSKVHCCTRSNGFPVSFNKRDTGTCSTVPLLHSVPKGRLSLQQYARPAPPPRSPLLTGKRIVTGRPASASHLL